MGHHHYHMDDTRYPRAHADRIMLTSKQKRHSQSLDLSVRRSLVPLPPVAFRLHRLSGRNTGLHTAESSWPENVILPFG